MNKKAQKKKKSPNTISRQIAVRRLDEMIVRIEENVQIALWAKAAFQSANTIVASRKNRPWEGSDTYNNVAQSLIVVLAASLARLYDRGTQGRHANERDVASIPLLIRLLKQRRCQKVLLERAQRKPRTIPLRSAAARECQLACNSAIVVYEGWKGSWPWRTPVEQLREFRNFNLSHSLMREMRRKPPSYDELLRLVDHACQIAEYAKLAITGEKVLLKSIEKNYRKDADVFWLPALTR